MRSLVLTVQAISHQRPRPEPNDSVVTHQSKRIIDQSCSPPVREHSKKCPCKSQTGRCSTHTVQHKHRLARYLHRVNGIFDGGRPAKVGQADSRLQFFLDGSGGVEMKQGGAVRALRHVLVRIIRLVCQWTGREVAFAVVQQMSAVEVVDVERLGDTGDHIVDFALDVVLDRIEQ